MAERPFDDLRIRFGPPYHYSQRLAPDCNFFPTAYVASEKILANPANIVETRIGYEDVACFNAAVPAEIAQRIIPGTRFSAFDFSLPLNTTLDRFGVSMKLYDADNPNRTIEIAPQDESAHPDILSLRDSHPNRKPRSMRHIGLDSVIQFLRLQLEAKGDDNSDILNIPNVGRALGAYARGHRIVTLTGTTALSGGWVLHTEKESAYELDDETNAITTTHSPWMASDLSKAERNMGDGITVRTVARLNPQNFRGNRNSLFYEIEAREIRDPEVFTERIIRRTATRKQKIAQTFASCLEQYLLQE